MLFDIVMRTAVISLVVIGSTQAIRWLGPTMGGVVVGMPVVAGPAYFILLLHSPPDFVAVSAGHSLLFLSAAHAFLVVFIYSVKRLPAWVSFVLAGAGWLAYALVLSVLPPEPWLGLGVFIVSAAIARMLAKPAIVESAVAIGQDSAWVGALRGIASGIFVTVATLAATVLGPAWSGLLLIFPVGYVAISVASLKIYGADVVNAMLYSSMLGALSIACFCFVLILVLHALPPMAAFAIAMLAALLTTAVLSLFSRRPPSGAGNQHR